QASFVKEVNNYYYFKSLAASNVLIRFSDEGGNSELLSYTVEEVPAEIDPDSCEYKIISFSEIDGHVNEHVMNATLSLASNEMNRSRDFSFLEPDGSCLESSESDFACGSVSVYVEIVAGKDAICDFALNFPGKSIKNDVHLPPSSPTNIALSSINSLDQRDPLLIEGCIIDTFCFAINDTPGVQRLGKNKFYFKSGDSMGFDNLRLSIYPDNFRDSFYVGKNSLIKFLNFFKSKVR
ncbi:MAG: hypothetical protein HON90_03885, partial [Halobacteriovoraceae bacterium]|nr:hypothetical protein [Halobacteriovoraceae bacterium]